MNKDEGVQFDPETFRKVGEAPEEAVPVVVRTENTLTTRLSPLLPTHSKSVAPASCITVLGSCSGSDGGDRPTDRVPTDGSAPGNHRLEPNRAP